ncbi:MAG: PAS domain S-box protein [Daejeonella sp.]|uniref:PAS domain S-box protein n=1 Tax=Daejeonella sp. TaxID=2805397 RepID=UPI003C75D041
MQIPDIYFSDLFDNTSDLIQYVSEDGAIENVNPAWLLTLGYRFDEVKGRSIYDFVAEEERSEFRAYRETTLVKQVNDDIQVTFLARNGTPVILQGHLRAFYRGGTVLHTRGVFRDVTAKIEAEKLQQEYFSRIAEFLANAPDAVVIIDETQNVIEWNQKATDIFGYTAAEVLNQPLTDLIIPVQFREAHTKGMTHFLNTGHGPVLNSTIEVPAIDKNLREFPVSLSISAVKINTKWFFIAFINDISDRKQKERALIEKQMELERSQLDSHRNKEFLSFASHELKTPLTSLKAYLQLALKSFDQQPKKQTLAFLNKAEEVSDKLAKLILNLLDISKIQAGKLALQKQQVEITDIVREITDANQLLYSSHQLKFSFTEPICVEIDKERIEQVIVNVISNAVKYSPNAKLVELSVEKKKRHVQIAVKDYGIGINEENQSKIFDKFYRVEELTSKKVSGLGIGLFISSEIIRQHEGNIWVENNEEGGATFYITLPFR